MNCIFFYPKILSTLFLFGLFLLNSFTSYSQFSDVYNPEITRILFLLDGSGSMNEEWQGRSKFEIAKELILQNIDSLQSTNSTVEIGVRVFGHQHSRTEQNCFDTNLEVPFGRHEITVIRRLLNNITPQGWTPITYSLQRAANDFPIDHNSKNAIILITDGIETCGGDPCEAGSQLTNSRISLKPFIIGLGLSADKQNYFDCVGSYFPVSTGVIFKKVLNTIIKQTLNPTTAQINLLNEFDKPTETNVGISMYDSYSETLLYNFVHTLNEFGFPDTVRLNPTGKYDIEIHSIPPVIKNGIELTPGKHNIIAIKVPRGKLALAEGNAFGMSQVQCLVRVHGSAKTIYVQDFNSTNKYLTGYYDLEVLTLPRIHHKNIQISQGITQQIEIEKPGTLTLVSSEDGVSSIFIQEGEDLSMIYKFNKIIGKSNLYLLPGKYTLMTRLVNSKISILTRVQDFEINSGSTTYIRF